MYGSSKNFFLTLPKELCWKIVEYLTVNELLHLLLSSKTFYKLFAETKFFINIYFATKKNDPEQQQHCLRQIFSTTQIVNIINKHLLEISKLTSANTKNNTKLKAFLLECFNLNTNISELFSLQNTIKNVNHGLKKVNLKKYLLKKNYQLITGAQNIKNYFSNSPQQDNTKLYHDFIKRAFSSLVDIRRQLIINKVYIAKYQLKIICEKNKIFITNFHTDKSDLITKQKQIIQSIKMLEKKERLAIQTLFGKEIIQNSLTSLPKIANNSSTIIKGLSVLLQPNIHDIPLDATRKSKSGIPFDVLLNEWMLENKKHYNDFLKKILLKNIVSFCVCVVSSEILCAALILDIVDLLYVINKPSLNNIGNFLLLLIVTILPLITLTTGIGAAINNSIEIKSMQKHKTCINSYIDKIRKIYDDTHKCNSSECESDKNDFSSETEPQIKVYEEKKEKKNTADIVHTNTTLCKNRRVIPPGTSASKFFDEKTPLNNSNNRIPYDPQLSDINMQIQYEPLETKNIIRKKWCNIL